MSLRFWMGLIALGLVACFSRTADAAPPAVAGYADYVAFVAELRELEKSPLVELRSLGTTLGQREVFLLTVSEGDADAKPALLVVGAAHAPQLVGSEVAVRMVRRLIERAETDPAVEELLKRFTLYVIPRPSPDASERFFQAPLEESAVNLRATDDDRDGADGEDPCNDLNGDGLITMMRVEEPTGDWLPHPDDARILIKADPKQGEQGRYLLFTEGRDDDGDRKFNEDGAGGVDFNRNFPFAYDYFGVGSGPHQVSEVETRAVADFAFSRPNLGAVLCFGPQDNLMQPWKVESNATKYQPSITAGDEVYLNRLAAKFQEIHGGSEPPAPAKAGGDFAHWAWFQLGRWTFCSPGWWMPPTNAKAEGAPPEPKDETPVKAKTVEKRGADEMNALRWLKEQKIAGFVDWQPIEHPDFPGRRVEVGGFKPFVRLNPPAEEFDGLAKKHTDFLLEVTSQLPVLRLHGVEAKALGGGLFRVTARVLKDGELPLASAAGMASQQLAPIQIAIELPQGAELVTGHPRRKIKALAGRGGLAEQQWLIRLPKAARGQAKIKVWHPAAGVDEAAVELK